MKKILRIFAASLAMATAAIFPQAIHADDIAGEDAPSKKVALIIAANNEAELENYPQENKAVQLFKANYPDGDILSINDITELNPDTYSAVWYHIDRNGVNDNDQYLFLNKKNIVEGYVNAGGNLLLTKKAGCYLKSIVSDQLGFDHYGDAVSNSQTAIFKVNITPYGTETAAHPLFSNIEIDKSDINFQRITLIDVTDQVIENMNIMWNVDNKGGKDAFCNAYNAEILGSWGHDVNACNNVGIVEFKPQGERKGTILFIGIAAYQLYFNGENRAESNVVKLTTNAINFLGSGNNSGNNGDGGDEGDDPGNASGGGENFKPLRTNAVAFVRPNSPSEDELGAEETFKECYPNGHIISVDDLIKNTAANEDGLYELTIGTHHIEAVWIHINRSGISHTPKVNADDHSYKLPDEFMTNDFKDALYNYSIDGGKMFVSGLATLLLNRIGRQENFYTPNVYCGEECQEIGTVGQPATSGDRSTTLTWKEKEDEKADCNNCWGVSGQIYDEHHPDGFGNAGHAVYGMTFDDFEGYYAALTSDWTEEALDKTYNKKVMILGPKENSSIQVSDNNCMWYVPDENVHHWSCNNNAQIIGSWDHSWGSTTRYVGLVEFLPDNNTHHLNCSVRKYNLFGEYPRKNAAPSNGPKRANSSEANAGDTETNRPWQGHAVANGLAAFQFANKGDNAHYENLRNMTFNTINYLTQTYHVDNMNNEEVIAPTPSGVEEVMFEEVEEAPVYYNLQGLRVENPSNGIFVKVQGSKVSKVAIQ